MKTTTRKITYSSVYEEAYAASDRKKWLTLALKRYSNIIEKKQMIKHLHTMFMTQSIFSATRNESGSIEQEFEMQKQIIHALSNLNVKRIQRQGLKRIYRPNGPMFKKSCKEVDAIFTF